MAEMSMQRGERCASCGNDREWHEAHRPRHIYKPVPAEAVPMTLQAALPILQRVLEYTRVGRPDEWAALEIAVQALEAAQALGAWPVCIDPAPRGPKHGFALRDLEDTRLVYIDAVAKTAEAHGQHSIEIVPFAARCLVAEINRRRPGDRRPIGYRRPPEHGWCPECRLPCFVFEGRCGGCASPAVPNPDTRRCHPAKEFPIDVLDGALFEITDASTPNLVGWWTRRSEWIVPVPAPRAGAVR